MKMVSVFMITYNHEKFIGQAIESIIFQKTTFDFELVIGEDKSKDNTRAICERYAAQYPDKIRLLPSERNYGPIGNTVRTFSECKGKYIAICEGDDYWLYPEKLQKQVDYLEAHQEYIACFTSVEIKGDMEESIPYEKRFPKLHKDVFTLEDFVLSTMNIIPTASLLFRNILPNPLPDFMVNAIAGDLPLQLLIADKGKVKYLPERMIVYRDHAGGVTKSKENIEKGEKALVKMYQEADKYFNYKYTKLFKKKLLEINKVHLIFGARDKKGIKKINHYFKYMPEYIKHSDKINLKELLYYHIVLFFPALLRMGKKK